MPTGASGTKNDRPLSNCHSKPLGALMLGERDFVPVDIVELKVGDTHRPSPVAAASGPRAPFTNDRTRVARA